MTSGSIHTHMTLFTRNKENLEQHLRKHIQYLEPHTVKVQMSFFILYLFDIDQDKLISSVLCNVLSCLSGRVVFKGLYHTERHRLWMATEEVLLLPWSLSSDEGVQVCTTITSLNSGTKSLRFSFRLPTLQCYCNITDLCYSGLLSLFQQPSLGTRLWLICHRSFQSTPLKSYWPLMFHKGCTPVRDVLRSCRNKLWLHAFFHAISGFSLFCSQFERLRWWEHGPF